MAAVLLFAESYSSNTKEQEIQFFINETTAVKCWKDNDKGITYVFLPSFAELSTTTASIPVGANVSLDGKKLTGKINCSEFNWNREYLFEVDGCSSGVLVFLHSDNISTICITTVNESSLKLVHGDKEHKEYVDITMFSSSGDIIYQGDSRDQIRGHGNSTWRSEKKPYNLYLENPAILTGSQASDKWTLLSNPSDATNLRNKVVFDFAKKTGRYSWFSPENEYIDLYINGEYYGLYLLCEHVERTAAKLFDDVNNDSWILYQYELTWRLNEDDRLVDPYGEGIEIMLPKQYTEEDVAILLDNLAAIYQKDESKEIEEQQREEAALAHVDLDSWCRKYLIEEAFCNADSGKASQIFILDKKNGKTYAGPCWDYDQSLGKMRSVIWWSPNTFWASQGTVYRDIIQTETAQEYILELYRKEFSPALHTLISEELGRYIQLIRSAARMNLIRWSKVYDDASDNMENFISFLSDRVEFLDRVWIDGCKFYTIRFAGFYASSLCVVEGDSVFLPDPTEFALPEDSVWIREDTGEEYALYQENLTENIVLRALVPEEKHSQDDAADEKPKSENVSIRMKITIASLVLLSALLVVLFIIDSWRSRG